MKLWIIRHAESKGNATGNYSTAVSDSLSDKGREQAAALGQCLAPRTFDRILVSPLLRTMETVTPYLHMTQQRAELWPEIAEACWHPEREAPTNTWRTQPAPLSSAASRLFDYRDGAAIRPAHPESFGEGLRRVRVALDRLEALGEDRDASVLMVTHGHFIRELLNLMLDTDTIREFTHDNGGITGLTFDGRWTLDFCNRPYDRHRTESPSPRMGLRLLAFCLLPLLLVSNLTAATPCAKTNTWRSALSVTRQDRMQAGQNSGVKKPPEFALWKSMHDDFGDHGPVIMAARDRLRQEGLTLDSPDSAFKTPLQDRLTLAVKTLTYVKEAGADVLSLQKELTAIQKRITDSKEDLFPLYLDLVLLRRRILFAHPALAFDRILINVNPPTTYSHNGDQFLARHSRTGKGLLLLSGWKSESPGQRFLLKGKLPPGAFRSPDLHYDADRLLFAFSDHTETDRRLRRFFLYEAALDGSSVRQITGTGEDSLKTWDNRATVLIEDNDPCYLPDDSILFLSTRSQTFGRCHGRRYNPAWVLHHCDSGGNIRQLSFGNENEIEPAVLNDGRVAFTRWEYTDRHEMFFHKLWWCMPDGTSVAHLFGNDMTVPHQFLQVAPIPGTHKIVAVGQGHHSYNTGTIVVIDTNIADNGEKAITHITPETSYSESQGWPNPHYSEPYAITEELFLASRANHPVPRRRSGAQIADRGIYLLDPLGGRELIYEDPEMASFAPIPICKRQRPAMMPAKTPPAAQEWGTVFLQDAYLTRNDPEGKLKPGMIKALRVNALGIQPRAAKRGVSSYAVNNIPKKILGTVPVDEDGSAFFKVPARTALQIQTLDENGMAILTERSFFYLQPGETRSCVGCHEPYGSAPDMKLMSKMSRMTPVDLTPPAGPQYKGGLSFMRTVQPVLDRYCIGCHGLGGSDNEQARKLDLTNRSAKGGYTTPYRRLAALGDPTVGNKKNMGAHARNISRPRDYYAYRNKLSHMLLKNHSNCNLDRESFLRIIEWLDVNSQFYGGLFPNKLENRRLTDEKADATKALRVLINERFGDAIASQPLWTLINKAQVEESRILMAPLARDAGGWEQLKPLWQSKTDPGYPELMAAVDACIVKNENENTGGWNPTWAQGAGEPWVMNAREVFRAKQKNSR
jgi:broad specificity phosphatase PhoE